ncbi:hypothetical protein ACMZOO_00130 [Catenovulum sp. SX2]|uniref:hypothetical protein n=1 Tax=Catenovulum sp. SX2 TaxID=3398614 RepID=UPI003F87D066
MIKNLTLAVTLLASASSAHAFNFPNMCPSGQYHKVSGQISTKNISEHEQQGEVSFNLYKVKGFRRKLVASASGDIYGTIVNQDNFAITLNHQINLNDGLGDIYTYNDKAYVTGVTEFAKDQNGQLILNETTKLPTPCGFTVIEQVTDLQGVNGAFDGATGKLTAFGSINMCPQNADKPVHNQFSVSGYVCLQ